MEPNFYLEVREINIGPEFSASSVKSLNTIFMRRRTQSGSADDEVIPSSGGHPSTSTVQFQEESAFSPQMTKSTLDQLQLHQTAHILWEPEANRLNFV